ncbi:coenzyme F420 hydrogenase/dehydrogenase beta subunit N-terminal domain-containing protein [Plantactinospora veratri]
MTELTETTGPSARTRALSACLFGVPGAHLNLGVGALRAATVGGLLAREPDADVTVFDDGWGQRMGHAFVAGRPVPISLAGARHSRRYHRPESYLNMRISAALGGLGNAGLARIDAADVVLDVSGGDSFSDIYGEHRFRTVAWPKRLALLRRRPLVLLPQTYGPFRSARLRAEAAALVRGARTAWARDPESYAALADLLGPDLDPLRHREGVDVAFALEPRVPDEPAYQRLAGWFEADPGPVAGINVSGLMSRPEGRVQFGLAGDTSRVANRLCERLLEQPDTRVIIVPHVLTPAGPTTTGWPVNGSTPRSPPVRRPGRARPVRPRPAPEQVGDRAHELVLRDADALDDRGALLRGTGGGGRVQRQGAGRLRQRRAAPARRRRPATRRRRAARRPLDLLDWPGRDRGRAGGAYPGGGRPGRRPDGRVRGAGPGRAGPPGARRGALMARPRTVHEVAAGKLCTGCGVCAYLAPDEVRMVDVLDHGRRPLPITPVGAAARGAAAGSGAAAALDCCPGVRLGHDSSRPAPGEIPELRAAWGPVRAIWEGYAADPAIRYAGSSGGVATALAGYCLTGERMAGVLHIGARSDVPYLNETRLSRTPAELLDNAGSRYAPASPCDRLDLVESAEAPCVFVGKPCDVAAVRMARQVRPELDRRLGLTIAIFCAGTPTTRGTLEMLDRLGVTDPTRLESVHYRGPAGPARPGPGSPTTHRTSGAS